MILPLLGAVAWAGVGEGPSPEGLVDVVQPRRVAVVVGVDDYLADPTLGDLRFAGDDASEMALLLEDEGYEVHALVGRVDTQRFEQAFARATATLQREDLLLVYFAGHAQLQPGLDESGLQLLFSESRSADAWAGLSLRALEAAVDGVGARQRVVILDACYSRRTLELLRTENRGPVGAVALPAVGRFEAWIYAAAPEQPAQEDAALGHGVFTWYLLEALRGEGDLDGDGEVGVLEAFHHAGARTAAHTGYAQVPRIAEDRVGWRDLPLTGRPGGEPEQAILPWIEREFPTLQVFLDGAARGPGPVAPGRHDIRVEEGGRVVRRGTVSLRPGDVVDPGALRFTGVERSDGAPSEAAGPVAGETARPPRGAWGTEALRPATLDRGGGGSWRAAWGVRTGNASDSDAGTLLGAELAALRIRKKGRDLRAIGPRAEFSLGWDNSIRVGGTGMLATGSPGVRFLLQGDLAWAWNVYSEDPFGALGAGLGVWLESQKRDRWTTLSLGPQLLFGSGAGLYGGSPVGVAFSLRNGRLP